MSSSKNFICKRKNFIYSIRWYLDIRSKYSYVLCCHDVVDFYENTQKVIVVTRNVVERDKAVDNYFLWYFGASAAPLKIFIHHTMMVALYTAEKRC